ncbi:MAG: pilus assembly protein PilM [bacterium]|nr:pilus assembly protein PilM [bacterium]
MFTNSFNRFFPAPSFLVTPSFGLDISDESLKFIKLASNKTGIYVAQHGERKIPPGVIEAGKIKDPQKMEEILSLLRKEEGVKSVRVSLPEDQTYLFRLHLEKSGIKSIRESIELSLEEYIPVPAEEAVFDYRLLNEDKQSLQLQIAAISKNVIENYLTVFKNASILVHSVEIEAQAIARAVIKKGDLDTHMIVDFGEKRTGIFIISHGIAMFTSTLDFGGITLNNVIKKNLNVSYEEADGIKKKFGLQRNNPKNKEIFSIILNNVSILRDEVAKHFLYWHTHNDEEGKKNPPIQKIILCGGDSNLIGLADYLSVSLKTKVEKANVWINIKDTDKYIPEISFKRALSLAAALGLALGDFEHD